MNTYLDNLNTPTCELLRRVLRSVSCYATNRPVLTHLGICEDAFHDRTTLTARSANDSNDLLRRRHYDKVSCCNLDDNLDLR
jgi:hypothetical protein